MRRYIVMALVSPLWVGCASPQKQWEDSRYTMAMDTGRSVFDHGYMAQAAMQYETAFKRGLAANDAQAIHDAGYNLATAQLRQHHLAECLKTLDRLSRALDTRHWPEQADLHVIRSTALYQQHQWEEALSEARLALKDTDQESHYQAYMLIGLSAASLGQEGPLQEALQHLESVKHPSERVVANVMELKTHHFLMTHHWQAALDTARLLSKIREEQNDYMAMRRALSLEKRAYDAQGLHVEGRHLQQQISDSQANE